MEAEKVGKGPPPGSDPGGGGGYGRQGVSPCSPMCLFHTFSSSRVGPLFMSAASPLFLGPESSGKGSVIEAMCFRRIFRALDRSTSQGREEECQGGKMKSPRVRRFHQTLS